MPVFYNAVSNLKFKSLQLHWRKWRNWTEAHSEGEVEEDIPKAILKASDSEKYDPVVGAVTRTPSR